MFPWLSKFAFAYQLSSNLDDSQLRYGDIMIFKMVMSAILNFRN